MEHEHEHGTISGIHGREAYNEKYHKPKKPRHRPYNISQLSFENPNWKRNLHRKDPNRGIIVWKAARGDRHSNTRTADLYTNHLPEPEDVQPCQKAKIETMEKKWKYHDPIEAAIEAAIEAIKKAKIEETIEAVEKANLNASVLAVLKAAILLVEKTAANAARDKMFKLYKW